MIDKLAQNTALSIKKVVPHHPASVPVLKYALEAVYNTIFIIFFSLAIGVMTGRAIEVAGVLISFATLRQITGGIHLRSNTLCVLISTAGSTALSFVQFGTTTIYIVSAIAGVLTLIYAPSRLNQHSRYPKRYYPALKVAGVGLIALTLLFPSAPIAASILIQSCTLINQRKGGESHHE
ncbi:hypothetical protein C162_22003 [Paenibacillus sp. FSL R7-269]|uniref:accessory gene regulator ArgB-like protein n=1 Tax=Paenibacillus sp. FSL R7-269 TaxID=1226755 RepID=UPI0003E24FEE|nr:accessory gene regulator B family protein [Paenibacillus sp. FSL R7-269]ETT45255.1 hypothetical protein C162_22003 [Paenibacillus sp. FSL R7-269]